MTVTEAFQSGKLQEAVQALGEEVRNAPLDIKRRTFLFELLCFAGDYDRAEKHLNILADGGPVAQMGCLLYRSAIHAERTRQQMFLERAFPRSEGKKGVGGARNGRTFTEFCDADPRIGGSLEVFVAGSYSWISMSQIAAIEIPRPKRLRDLLWTPAMVTTTPAFSSMELGEVLLPVLCPLSSKHGDDAVRLGRSTVWEESGEGDPQSVPFGQKIFLIDDQEVPILELGRIELAANAGVERVASA